MDFEGAAARLAKDQSSIRRRGQVVVSAKAKREAELRRKQQAHLQAERQRKQRQLQFQKQYMARCDRALKVQSLVSSGAEQEYDQEKDTVPSSSSVPPRPSLSLKATSVYGDGDKIALPPSVLERLTTQGSQDENKHTPWMFRFSIRNPEYEFPASPLLAIAKPKGEHEDDDDEMSDEDMENDKAAYLDELGHRFLSYTHGTVVEFTQEEGHIGITQAVAAALLRQRPNGPAAVIPVTRTVDPAGDSAAMDKSGAGDDFDDEKTSGHLAWGAFDVPDVPIEVTRVTLPKGRGCTLVPTDDAIRHGFYSLKDVKLVLEQSLSRTRATLTVGDTVSTWHRGVRFDLSVVRVVPNTFRAISCINTDIEVEFGDAASIPTTSIPMPGDIPPPMHAVGSVLGTSTSVASLPSIPDQMIAEEASEQDMDTEDLLPEPPEEQKENILTVQMQSDTGRHRRKFDVSRATMKDLFAFAASVSSPGTSPVRLVTRFPRKVYERDNVDQTLLDAGIGAGQEVFLVEKD